MRWLKSVNKLFSAVLKYMLGLYRWVISPLIHALAGSGYGCRFEPVCSEYSRQAIVRFGAVRGLGLTFRRISRCHPFGGSGYDPIPVISALSNKNDRSLVETACKCRQTVEQR